MKVLGLHIFLCLIAGCSTMVDNKASNRVKGYQAISSGSVSVIFQGETIYFPAPLSTGTHKLLSCVTSLNSENLYKEDFAVQATNEFLKTHLPHKSAISAKLLQLSDYCCAEVVITRVR